MPIPPKHAAMANATRTSVASTSKYWAMPAAHPGEQATVPWPFELLVCQVAHVTIMPNPVPRR